MCIIFSKSASNSKPTLRQIPASKCSGSNTHLRLMNSYKNYDVTSWSEHESTHRKASYISKFESKAVVSYLDTHEFPPVS